MNRIKKSCDGFTIMELLMAALAFSIMMLVVASMLVYAWQGWKRNTEIVNMQRNATIALMMISKEIRNATYDEITAGSGISFAGSGESFSASGNRIVSNDGTVVVDAGLVSGSFITRKLQQANAAGVFKQWVEVNFTLETTTANEPYTVEVSPRN